MSETTLTKSNPIILYFNKLIRLFCLVGCLVFCLHFDALAQVKKAKKTKEKSEWTKDLWYGGGINLGFSSDYYNGLQSNYFVFGISPMVGYKLNSVISVGPRISIDWTIAKFNDGFQSYKYNSVDYGLGVFARFKFLDNLFAHAEYSQLNETYTTGYIVNNELEKFRQWRAIALLGLGYTTNQIWSYEINVNYNFLEKDKSYRLPIIYRAGITYNF